MIRRASAVLALAATSAAGASVVDLGFTGGTASLDLGRGAARAPTAAECGECHAQQHADWAGSRHRVSWSNEILQAGFVAEPRMFCVHCHAPLPEQAAEVVRNLAWYSAQDPRNPRSRAEKAPEPHAGEGITCVVCHWRDGEVLASAPEEGAPHAIRAAPVLADAEMCRDCHEFPMPAWSDGEMRFTDVPMQSTWSEWSAWRDAGGAQSCQDCHMPQGRHVFRGAHDREWLRASVRVHTERDGADARLVLESVDVGHHFPTGDLFRHLTVEIEQDGAWTHIATIGRSFRLAADERTGVIAKVLDSDTSLRPGERRTVRVTAPEGARWRLRYHYGAAHDETRGLLDPDAIIATLHEGVL